MFLLDVPAGRTAWPDRAGASHCKALRAQVRSLSALSPRGFGRFGLTAHCAGSRVQSSLNPWLGRTIYAWYAWYAVYAWYAWYAVYAVYAWYAWYAWYA